VKTLLTIIGVLAAPWMVSAVEPAHAADPTFEVASVKPNTSGSTDSRVSMPPGRLMVTNLPVSALIEFAYGLSMLAAPPGAVPTGLIDAVIGGPGWLQTDRFDVDAVAEGSPTREQMLMMLRALLRERFKLAVHTEARERPIFALVLARTDGRFGPRMRVSEGACRSRTDRGAATTLVDTQSTRFCGISFIPGGMTGEAVTMTQVASTVSRFLGADVRRHVADRTGLSGVFDLTLEFTQASSSGLQLGRQPVAGRGGSAVPPRPAAEPDPFATNIFIALQEQLGLKLEPSTGPGDVLVIDAVERPSEN
jgi:uncharacterized protein (TIGR03435 family)